MAKPVAGRERRIPNQRERCQLGYNLLRELLRRSDSAHLLDQLDGLDDVDDVLRFQPAFIPVLLNAAWELRGEAKFADLFLNAETRQPVQTRDEPIHPCGRTFNEVMQSHLYGAARLYFLRLEKDWAAARAREEQRRWKKAQDKKRGTLTGRLSEGIKELAGKTKEFNAEDYRADYEGFGLYEAIKPHLEHEWQFRLIPLYARLSTRQAQAYDDLIQYFRTPKEMEAALLVRSEDVSMARGYARIHAEALQGIDSSNRRPSPTDDQVEIAAKRAAALKDERRVFDLLLTRHLDCLEVLKGMGNNADSALRRLTKIFRDDVWSVVRDETQLRNALNCPDYIVAVIGPSCRGMPPEIGTILGQIQNRILTRDLLTLAAERFTRADLERYMSDPERKPIWNQLPAKFNNNYNYQPDAPRESSNAKNFENLQMVCEGIFTSLTTGHVEKLKA
ncbi:MAG: hypothetical protein WCZ23_12135 [Rhodospirillaceae bacterium]